MMPMRGPATDLPIEFAEVTILARDVRILDRVTLTLSAGTPTVMVGPNGSGKTTLLRVAMGLMPPTQGSVTWGGRSQVPPLRRAIMFQRPAMLRRSATGNLRYALAAAGVARGRRADRAKALLDLVGLSGLGERPARRMSGGEQQRLALARALAKEPEILFLDEPAASLDPAATKALEDTIRLIAQRGIKVVLTTHDLTQARRLGGDVVFLNRGRVVETGDAQAFFANPKTEDARRFVAGEILV
jgi:tungstate transport system ATP-binding protein